MTLIIRYARYENEKGDSNQNSKEGSGPGPKPALSGNQKLNQSRNKQMKNSSNVSYGGYQGKAYDPSKDRGNVAF